MSNEVLDKIVQQIQEDSRSGQSLLLFALIQTLDTAKGGHMYMLSKLKEFSPQNRELAYALMEIMANGGNHGEFWSEMQQKIEAAIMGKKYQ